MALCPAGGQEAVSRERYFNKSPSLVRYRGDASTVAQRAGRLLLNKLDRFYSSTASAKVINIFLGGPDQITLEGMPFDCINGCDWNGS